MAHPAVASKLPPFTLLEEPLLAFSPANPDEVDVHPLRGLVRYGLSLKAHLPASPPKLGWPPLGLKALSSGAAR